MLSIFLASITLLTACSSNQSSGSSSGSSSGTSQSDPGVEKAKSSLTGLENNIEMVIKALGGPAVQQESQQNSGSLQTSRDDESQGNKSSQQAQQGQESQNSQQGQQSQGNQSSQQGQQNKASSTNQQNLMDKVSSKDKMNALLAANQLYDYIPDLYALIKPRPSPEIKKILYYSRNIILNSSVANWAQADSDIKSLKSTWDIYKNSLSKDQKDAENKLELSIYELEKVVKNRNESLVDIKGKVEFSNIIALEKATENESGSNSQQSSGS